MTYLLLICPLLTDFMSFTRCLSVLYLLISHCIFVLYPLLVCPLPSEYLPCSCCLSVLYLLLYIVLYLPLHIVLYLLIICGLSFC